MPLTMIVTDAGRAAIVNAQHNGTAPVTITQCGLSGSVITPAKTATALAGEFKRISTISGAGVAADTIHLIVRDESADVYTARAFALYLADGTLFAIYGQPAALVDKTAQSIMLLALDVVFADITAASLTFGNANFLNPPATETVQGVVELATSAEATAGTDTQRAVTPKAIQDAVNAWLDARFGANNSLVWNPGNDGAGSGLDAGMFAGQLPAYYTNIVARLGYTPLNATNYTAADVLAKFVTVDGAGSGTDADLLDGQHGSYYLAAASYTAADVKAKMLTLDGAGSGLDADLLDGQDGSYYSNIIARLGYTPLNKAGDTYTGALTFGAGSSCDFSTNDIWPSMRVFRNAKAASDGLYVGYGNANGGRTRIYGDGSTTAFVFPDVNGNLYRSDNAPYWHSGNDGAGSGSDADMVDGWHRDSIRDWNNLLNKPFNWAGQAGQPSWVWGSNDGATYYVWNPSNFNVNYANSAGNADMVDGRHASEFMGHSNDGAGSGFDADMLDGRHGSEFMLAQAFAASLGNNGYQKLGNLLIQWGRNRSATNNVSAVFTQAYNVAFSGTAYVVVLFHYDASGLTYNQKHYVKRGDGDANGFPYQLQDDDSGNSSLYGYGFDWIAIGPA